MPAITADPFGGPEEPVSARTTFAAPGGIPEPVVSPAAPRPLPLVDLAGLPEPSWKTELARLSTEERRRPFDLAAGPLLRVSLVRLAAGRILVPSSPDETAVREETP